jgi:hypothetical protein
MCTFKMMIRALGLYSTWPAGLLGKASVLFLFLQELEEFFRYKLGYGFKSV